MKLGNRIFLGVFGLIVFSTVAGTMTGAVLISAAVRAEALSRVEQGLREAGSEIDGRLESLALAARILARGLEGALGLPVDPDIVIRFPSPGAPGGALPASLVSAGLSGAAPARGYILLGPDLLRTGDYEPATPGNLAACSSGQLLCLFALEPDGQGCLLAATRLNGNEVLVRDIQDHLFGEGRYGDKPFGTVTVFCGDLRVATTVLGPQGEPALGTRVSAAVREKVLERGERWLGRALVVDQWYLSAYEPIRDPSGTRVGILYVGVLERKYVDIRTRAVSFLSGLIVPMLGLVLAAVFFITRGVVRPLSRLAEAAARIREGRFDTDTAPPGGAQEIHALAEGFQHMKEAIRERENRLRRQNVDLEEANRDYQELLSFVTHELNNSIGALLLNVSVLAEETESCLAAEPRSTLDQIVRDVERFRDMVRNYLNLSRLEKGTLRYNPGPLDVRARVIEPVLGRLERWLRHRGFEVRWQWPSEVTVWADPDLLEICYSNFVVNALKYGRGWIRFTAQRREDSWILGVENGGSPIPVEKTSLLFQKFSRLVGSSDGAGLGLYLVRRIVERHGGEVWCEAIPAQGEGSEAGTRFLMRLGVSGEA
jgi:two-component system NtrC family sensor kinase